MEVNASGVGLGERGVDCCMKGDEQNKYLLTGALAGRDSCLMK